ncbi:MAG TPA: hypothetical protein VJI12_03220 [archaeon]|nr:hypothetical protein [archaeon]
MKLWILLAALLAVSPVFADFQANATISPRYVDTSVFNQTFVYTIQLLNDTLVNRTIVYAPENYTIIELRDVTTNPTNDSCRLTSCTQVEVNSSQIAINFSVAVNGTTNSPIIITFGANTSASASTGTFTSYLNNTIYHNITNSSGINLTQVITQPMIVANVTMTKGTAVLNGSDFWEFKFTLGLTAAQSGLVQFKMNDWTCSDLCSPATNNKFYINTSLNDSYLSLRNESAVNTTGKFNVTLTYGNMGINKASTAVTDFYLKMMIPASAPLSSTWSSTYNFLFRAYP